MSINQHVEAIEERVKKDGRWFYRFKGAKNPDPPWSHGVGAGAPCPKCGAKTEYYRWTRRKKGIATREAICEECGHIYNCAAMTIVYQDGGL